MVCGTVYANCPGLSGGIESVAPDFTDVYKYVPGSNAVQVFCDDVAAVALGYGVVVEAGISK